MGKFTQYSLMASIRNESLIKRSGYIYLYNCFAVLYTENWNIILNQLYPIKFKNEKCDFEKVIWMEEYQNGYTKWMAMPRESVPRQVDKPKIPKQEKGVWNS